MANNQKLALIKGPPKSPTTETEPKYQFGGRPAPSNMRAGEYPVVCTSAAIRRKGNKMSLVLTFEVAAGPMQGVELLMWLALPEKGKKITYRSDIWKHFALALGRQPGPDDFNEQVFVNKHFLAYVGYSRRDPDTKQEDIAHAARKKYDRDFPRCHDLKAILP